MRKEVNAKIVTGITFGLLYRLLSSRQRAFLSIVFMQEFDYSRLPQIVSGSQLGGVIFRSISNVGLARARVSRKGK